MKMKCPLCNPEKKTKWYYDDGIVRIIDCETCNIPMVVLVRHGRKVDLL